MLTPRRQPQAGTVEFYRCVGLCPCLKILGDERPVSAAPIPPFPASQSCHSFLGRQRLQNPGSLARLWGPILISIRNPLSMSDLGCYLQQTTRSICQASPFYGQVIPSEIGVRAR
jgi:hypothetical protein